MGVMSCCRKNCDNIMCDNYITNIGYICNDCLSELYNYKKRNIEKFLNTKKSEKISDEEQKVWEDYVNNMVERR